MRPNSPSVTRIVPTTSRLLTVESLDSSTAKRTKPNAITPIGTLIQKTALQPTCSVRKPPSKGPRASPRPETPAQIPIACGSLGRGNVATRIDSDSGFISAAPVPCSARKMISCSAVCDSAHATENTVNSTRPTMNMRLRPKRSPSLPPRRISAAKTRMYALMIHCRPLCDGSRSCWIVGSATFTTVLSSMIMNSAKHIANSVSHMRRLLRTGVVGAVASVMRRRPCRNPARTHYGACAPHSARPSRRRTPRAAPRTPRTADCATPAD